MTALALAAFLTLTVWSAVGLLLVARVESRAELVRAAVRLIGLAGAVAVAAAPLLLLTR